MATKGAWKASSFYEECRKPEGGFQFVAGDVLLSAWWAYRRKIIELADLRTWFACHELVARRSASEGHRFNRYTLAEIQVLTAARHTCSVKDSLARLQRASLIRWSESEISFSSNVQYSLAGSRDFPEAAPCRRRSVPVPRRVLRFLARCSRPSVIATLLGHLYRCLHYRAGQCVSGGFCKASWIALTFDVDVRRIKAARAELVRLGILGVSPMSQRVLNRYGAAVRLNLAWQEPRAVDGENAPPTPVYTGGLSLPLRNHELATRLKKHEPARRGPAGLCRELEPSLQSVRWEDLLSVARRETLFRQAVDGQVVTECDANRLRFHAAAYRAVRVGRTNPCGMFVAIVRRGLWSYLSTEDEERARRALAQQFWEPGAELTDKAGRVPERKLRHVREGIRGAIASLAGPDVDYLRSMAPEFGSLDVMRPSRGS